MRNLAQDLVTTFGFCFQHSFIVHVWYMPAAAADKVLVQKMLFVLIEQMVLNMALGHDC